MDIPDSSFEHHISSGDVLVNRYEVVRVLGSGSMGVVYQCYDRNSAGRSVAVKILYAELASDQAAMTRFRNEVRASHQVVHRNVVQSFDYLHHGKLVAYSMEYVDGYSLAKMMSGRPPLPIPVAIEILMQVCLGVQAIHQVKIVHRDLKPENVVVSNSGDAKIMDFGIARLDKGRRITARGSILGTFEYMSPEYLSEGTVHPLGDIYSLGVIAYQVVTGRLPHQGENLIACLKIKVSEDPIDPLTLRPECPPALSAMILQALSRDPRGRYQCASEFYDDLQQLGLHNAHGDKKTLELNEQQKSASKLKRAVGRPESRNAKSGREPRIAGIPPIERERTSGVSSAIHSEIQTRFLTPLRLIMVSAIATVLALLATKSFVAAGPNSLSQAARSCNFESAEALLKDGLPVNALDSSGSTPLCQAVKGRCLAIANLLLEGGADPSLKDISGKTPIELARNAGYSDLVNLLAAAKPPSGRAG